MYDHNSFLFGFPSNTVSHDDAHTVKFPAVNDTGSRKDNIFGFAQTLPLATLSSEGTGPALLGLLPSQVHQITSLRGTGCEQNSSKLIAAV